ncbi:MAG: C40 family peptidase, partial [Polyangiales bacterium]
MLALVCACSGPARPPQTHKPGATCSEAKQAPQRLPGVQQAQRQARYWIDRALAAGDADRILLSRQAVVAHSEAIAHAGPLPFTALAQQKVLPATVQRQVMTLVRERIAAMDEAVRQGVLRQVKGQRLPAAAWRDARRWSKRALGPAHLRVVLAPTLLRCAPLAGGMYKLPVDKRFDRNACSMLRPQEAVVVLGPTWQDMQLVLTRYVLGWISADAALSPPLKSGARQAWLDAPRWRLQRRRKLGRGQQAQTLPRGTLLPTAGPDAVWLASRHGVQQRPRLSEGHALPRALTRRAFLRAAFAYHGSPYGWGGYQSGRDCSRYVMEVLGSFGLRLPRHSSDQAAAGSFVIEVPKTADAATRQRLLDAAHKAGLVLIQMPGHIMFYLGRSAEGVPMALHSFAEYAKACPGHPKAPDQIYEVGRVDVSTLALGQGSRRHSYLQRMRHVTVFADALPPALAALAKPRPAAPVHLQQRARCRADLPRTLFINPHAPVAGERMSVLVQGEAATRPLSLRAEAATGRLLPPVQARRLDGPPTAQLFTLTPETPGRLRLWLGDGPELRHCVDIHVRREPPPGPPVVQARLWQTRWQDLFAHFVEALLRDPEGEDATWPNLHTLLRDAKRNLLYNHGGQTEDERLALKPDCADLPYFLRAYFAWKLRLPFGFRRCDRGSVDRAPQCEPLQSNLL